MTRSVFDNSHQAPKVVQFGVWDDIEGFWQLFDSLEDAVSTAGDDCTVYQVEAKCLGVFRRRVEIVKQPTKKKK